MGDGEVERSLTAELRRITRGAHQALDSHPILVDLAKGTIDDQRYLKVLTAFAGVWRQAEPGAWARLIDRLPALAPFEEHRSAILAADIEALSGHPPEAPPHRAPPISAPDQAAGALYVLEGARLGALLIAERLRKAGRPVGQPGYRFFGAPSKGAADRWQRLRGVIDAPPWSAAEIEAAADTALAVFRALADALSAEFADAG